MKTDLELLGAAGKAAGIALVPYTWNKGTNFSHDGFTVADEGPDEWNPLEDDGEALRLAVTLSIRLEPSVRGCTAMWRAADGVRVQTVLNSVIGADSAAATRLAIVRAAAAMADC